MAIAEETLASVFATKFLNNLISGPLHQLGIANGKSGESND